MWADSALGQRACVSASSAWANRDTFGKHERQRQHDFGCVESGFVRVRGGRSIRMGYPGYMGIAAVLHHRFHEFLYKYLLQADLGCSGWSVGSEDGSSPPAVAASCLERCVNNFKHHSDEEGIENDCRLYIKYSLHIFHRVAEGNRHDRPCSARPSVRPLSCSSPFHDCSSIISPRTHLGSNGVAWEAATGPSSFVHFVGGLRGRLRM